MRRLKKHSNKVRIIAGQLRGRMVEFADHNGLRPTGDRLRETLFSWLQPYLHGSRCLDMFAGSGVLGFESISRGASAAVLIEKSPDVTAMLLQNARALSLSNAVIVQADAVSDQDLVRYCAPGSIDIAFIDPPFAENLQQRAVDRLSLSEILAPDALVAVESGKRQEPLRPPADWLQMKEKVTGEVRLQLFRRSG